jgi:hypothetical protein
VTQRVFGDAAVWDAEFVEARIWETLDLVSVGTAEADMVKAGARTRRTCPRCWWPS